MKKNELLRDTFFITLLIIFSKILGFAREALIAFFYGANWQTDAFFFSQGMPGMIFPAVCNSIALAFTSCYVIHITMKGEKSADLYASRILTASLGLGLILGLLGVIFAPILVRLFAPGFNGEQLTLAIHLTKLTMGAFVLIMAQYMLSAILNSKKLFIGSQIAGIFYNVVIILITIFLGRRQNMDILTLTVVFGLLIQVLVLFICCRGHFKYSLGISPFHKDTFSLFRLALPIFFGNSIIQINNIVDKFLCSSLSEGSLSALSYALTLDSLVVSVFVMSLSTILYPMLTADAASGNMSNYGKNIMQSIIVLCLILVPISFITVISSEDIVKIVFGRGSFDKNAVSLTSIALACYAPRFVLFGIREVLTRGFFAIQDTKSPMFNSAIGVVCNIILSIVLVRFYGIAGIALGTTISSFIIAVLLLITATKKIETFKVNIFLKILGKQLIAGTLSILVLKKFHHLVNIQLPIVRFSTNVIIVFIIYFSVIFLICKKDMKLLFSLKKNKK